MAQQGRPCCTILSQLARTFKSPAVQSALCGAMETSRTQAIRSDVLVCRQPTGSKRRSSPGWSSSAETASCGRRLQGEPSPHSLGAALVHPSLRWLGAQRSWAWQQAGLPHHPALSSEYNMLGVHPPLLLLCYLDVPNSAPARFAPSTCAQGRGDAAGVPGGDAGLPDGHPSEGPGLRGGGPATGSTALGTSPHAGPTMLRPSTLCWSDREVRAGQTVAHAIMSPSHVQLVAVCTAHFGDPNTISVDDTWSFTL